MILYIETNFAMSIATGRDPQATQLLLNIPPSIEIAIPSVCFMEALSSLEADLKYRRRFHDEISVRLSDAKRNLASQHAQILSFHLEQTRDENDALIEEVKTKLFSCLNELATKAEIIALNTEIIQATLQQSITDEPTDKLILNSIFNHAKLHPPEIKIFLSGNTKDFGNRETQEALREVGIDYYFANTQAFLNWLENQPS
jgi:hypothetical protein